MTHSLHRITPRDGGRRCGSTRRLVRLAAACMAFVLLAACKVPLHSGLQEREANEMLGKLLEYNIDAAKQTDKDNLVTLMVDEAQFGEAVDLLKRFGLPRPDYETMGEVFTGDGLVASPVTEWARFNFALSQELSNMVSSIPGVISAQVHIANPRKETPFDEVPLPSASVLALVSRDAMTAELVPQIKQLVAFSVEKIDYDRVGVVVSPVDPPVRPELDLVALGGVIMHRNSQTQAILLIVALVVVCLGLGAGGYFGADTYLKTRKARKAAEA